MNYEIAILGAGNVGKTLGLKWAKKGHKVTFGVRTPEKYKELGENNANISVTTLQDAVKSHELLVLALPGDQIGSILQTIGNLDAKKVIDASNMFGMNKLEEMFPKTHFVKAFNHIGYNIMDQPQIGNDKVTLLYCGSNDKLLNLAKDLIIDMGFDPFLVGDSSFAGDLENYAMLWIKMSRKIGRDFGFKLLY